MGDYFPGFRVSVTPFVEKGVSSGTVCFGRYETRIDERFWAENDVAFEEKRRN